MQLTEQYRPQRWEEVVGQDKIVTRVRALAQRGGLAGRAFFISGQSGMGKTTIARLIAADVAPPLAIQESNSADITPGGRARDGDGVGNDGTGRLHLC